MKIVETDIGQIFSYKENCVLNQNLQDVVRSKRLVQYDRTLATSVLLPLDTTHCASLERTKTQCTSPKVKDKVIAGLGWLTASVMG